MQVKGVKPIKGGLFSWPSEAPRLLASRCSKCETVAFPAAEYCPSCTQGGMAEIELSSSGKLVSFSSVLSSPPEYKGETPYGVGIVAFPEGVRIIGLLSTADLASLRPGMDVAVVVEEIYQENSYSVVSYRFRPEGHL